MVFCQRHCIFVHSSLCCWWYTRKSSDNTESAICHSSRTLLCLTRLIWTMTCDLFSNYHIQHDGHLKCWASVVETRSIFIQHLVDVSCFLCDKCSLNLTLIWIDPQVTKNSFSPFDILFFSSWSMFIQCSIVLYHSLTCLCNWVILQKIKYTQLDFAGTLTWMQINVGGLWRIYIKIYLWNIFILSPGVHSFWT